MHRTRTLALALFALVAGATAVTAQHADHDMALFDGTWELTFETQMGDAVWMVELEVADDAITGVAVTEVGNMAIEGQQDGEAIEFTLFLDAPDHAVEFYFSGTVDGDTAAGAVTIMSQAFAWTGTRTGD